MISTSNRPLFTLVCIKVTIWKGSMHRPHRDRRTGGSLVWCSNDLRTFQTPSRSNCIRIRLQCIQSAHPRDLYSHLFASREPRVLRLHATPTPPGDRDLSSSLTFRASAMAVAPDGLMLLPLNLHKSERMVKGWSGDGQEMVRSDS
jgi:hypothetical protein